VAHTNNNPGGTGGSLVGVESGEVYLPNDRAQIDALVSQLAAALDRHQYPEPSRFAVRLALEEAISNAFRHGHRELPPHTPVHVWFQVGRDHLTLRIADQGPGFDPGAVPDPTLDENLERPSGRGIMLMRAYMTRVEYEEPGNRVMLHYRRPAVR
jgi:serine/threonine-protein kinase RsbW